MNITVSSGLKWLIRFMVFSALIIIFSGAASGQFPGIEDSIAKYRKGTLVIKAKPGAQIKVEQISHEFWFGCAITSGFASPRMPAEIKKIFKEKFLENFNSAVTENAVKWPSMERIRGEVSYAEVDTILKWTEENKIPLRAHNLFWGISQFIQPWVKELSNDELRETIRNRAETVTARYRGRFAEYDLNNEMVHGNYYEERLGPGITKLMAQWAHKGDPGAKLFLNEYDILTGKKLPEYMAQIRSLLQQGVPIAGIGVQGHLHAETFDRQALKDALDSLAIFRLPIRITEFNMPGQRSAFYHDRNLTMTPEKERVNARELVDYYRICFAHPAVEGILMWGFWAGANWIPSSSLYRRDWSVTETGKAYKELIFNEWWIRISGTSGTEGTLTVPAFFGKYKITVDGISREVNLTGKKGKEVIDFTSPAGKGSGGTGMMMGGLVAPTEIKPSDNSTSIILENLTADNTRMTEIPEASGLSLTKDIVYHRGVNRDGNELPVKMDLITHRKSGKRPCIIFITGGGFMFAPKGSELYKRFLIAKAGYVVGSVEYHVISNGIYSDAVKDIKAAVRFLRTNAEKYGIDPHKIALWGESAGGYLTAMTGTTNGRKEFEAGDHLDQSSDVQACIDVYGLSDLTRIGDDYDEAAAKSHYSVSSPDGQYIHGKNSGLTSLDKPDVVAKSNPVNYVDKNDPPFLFIHGMADGLVSPSQTLLLHNAMSLAGVPSTRYVIRGAGHGGPPFSSPEVVRIMTGFLDKYLK